MSENRELLDRVLSRFTPDPDDGLARTLRRVQRRQRRRGFVAAALGFVAFVAAGVLLWSALRPAHLQGPVSPPSSIAHGPSPSPAASAPTWASTPPPQPYPHHIAPGFVREQVKFGSVGTLVVESPPGSIRWTLDSATCTVRDQRVPGGGAGNMGGGSFGGSGCGGNAYLATNGQGGAGFRLGFFSVAAGRALPVGGVRVRVTLADGAHETVQPTKGLWMVVVQRCGNYRATEPRTVEAVSATGKVLARVTLPKEPLVGGSC